MKRLIVSALLCLSAQAAMAQQTCEVNMVDNLGRVVRNFRAYGEPSSCLEGMKECRKSIRLDYSQNPQYPNGSLDCVRVNYIPVPQQPIPVPQQPIPRPQQPIPAPDRPIPRPQQPIPQPRMEVSVSGLIESTPFTFVAYDPADLYMSCIADIGRIYNGQIDDLFFSVNNNRFIQKRNESYYYSHSDVCSIIEQEARRTFNAVYTNQVRIVGSLESAPFQIVARDRAELLDSCLTSFAATRLGQTDDLRYSVNGGQFVTLRNQSAYWGDTARACIVLLKSVDPIL